MSQTRTISSQATHLSWDSILLILFGAFAHCIIGYFSSNSLYRLYYYGCATGMIQCLITNEVAVYSIYFLENYARVDFSVLFGHIQLAPYTPQVVSSSDDDGYSEGSEDEKEKDD
jgi:hypothetical protein